MCYWSGTVAHTASQCHHTHTQAGVFVYGVVATMKIHIQCHTWNLAFWINAYLLNLLLPNFTPIWFEMTEPLAFFKRFPKKKKRHNNKNTMSSDMASVPDRKSGIYLQFFFILRCVFIWNFVTVFIAWLVLLCNSVLQYESAEQAVATREALHGKRWPANNPKLLGVEFRTMEEVLSSCLLDDWVPSLPYQLL